MNGLDLFAYNGYEIPVHLIAITGAGPESFEAISRDHMNALQRYVGVQTGHNFLEVGCGIGRDAMPLAEILTEGSYVGVDIIKQSIDWCKSNITTRHPNFSFCHLDIKDQLHNPYGSTETRKVMLPVADGSIDRIILWSVFTHMFRYDIVHYLDEFRRVLKSDGLVFATVFVGDEESLARSRQDSYTIYNLRFDHPYGPGCLVQERDRPAAAVAFTEEAINEMVAAAGLKFAVPIVRGNWSGRFSAPDMGQDAVILKLPD